MTRAEKWKQSPEQVTAARAAKRLMPAWYALAIVVLTTLAMAGVALGVAQYTAKATEQRLTAQSRENEQKWCSIVVTLDDAYHHTPPSSPLGRQLAGDMAQLRRDLGC